MGITLYPLHPVVVAAGQLHILLRLRQGAVSQPLLEHRLLVSFFHRVTGPLPALRAVLVGFRLVVPELFHRRQRQDHADRQPLDAKTR